MIWTELSPKLASTNMESWIKERWPYSLFSQVSRKGFVNVQEIRDKFTASANENAVQNEWKFAAAVLDRIFLSIFSMLIAGTIIFLVIQTPYLLDGHIR
jgi:hypothetical protein